MDPAFGKKDRPEAQENNGGLSATSGRALGGYPPGGFSQRVRKRLKTRELSFARVRKNAKESKRARKSMKTKDGTVVGREEWLLGFARSELVPLNWESGYTPRGDENSA